MEIPDWIKDLGKVVFTIIFVSNILLLAWLLAARWYRRWKYHKLKKGLINYLGLSEWHESLSTREQGLFKKYYTAVSNIPSQVDRLTQADIYSASETPTQLLVMTAAGGMMEKDFTFSEKLLFKASSLAHSPWEKQQVLLAYSYLFFKQRDQLSAARENCMNYSDKAIKSIERFGVSDDKPPTLPFEQLITMHEERQDYQKAAEIAKRAVDLFSRRHRDIAIRFIKRREKLLEQIMSK
jgi:hypothetical protein